MLIRTLNDVCAEKPPKNPDDFIDTATQKVMINPGIHYNSTS